MISCNISLKGQKLNNAVTLSMLFIDLLKHIQRHFIAVAHLSNMKTTH